MGTSRRQKWRRNAASVVMEKWLEKGRTSWKEPLTETLTSNMSRTVRKLCVSADECKNVRKETFFHDVRKQIFTTLVV